ncbi:YycH family regulatory protein [Neobacillus sp. D3-1R]|uniref:YycH family regulatory protein n=1 Tax=Neobacillus sp. D3-1R TaxID=3445778 RepID=UPI003FA0EE56
MTYENIKSTILTFLVLSSFFLTWNLWTYQPNYELMENTKYVQEVAIGEKRDIKKVVKPDKVIFHYQNSHYGTINTVEIDKMIHEMSDWNIYDLKNYTNKVEDFTQTIHGNGNVEIIFPEKVPIDIYKNVLDFENKSLPRFSFDRIVIDMDNIQKETGTIYFVDYEKKIVFISHVSSTNLTNFNRSFYKVAYRYPSYFLYQPSKEKALFIPENDTNMIQYKYFPDFLDSDKFKEALFTDPSFVQKSPIPEGEEFTNGSSKMNIYKNSNLLFYVNPIEESEFVGNSIEILQRGIEFINEHAGWTDPYRYVGLDLLNQKVTFRLYSSDGYPVFNESGMSEIIEVWGRNEINKYLRPNFSLDLPLRSEMSEITTPSGKKIIEFLEKQKGFKPESLTDLRLGYHMEKDPKEPKLIVLEPSWFYRYNDKWGQIRLDAVKGERNGLE